MTTTQRLWILGGLIFAGWLIHLLGPVLTPFLISALLAYMADPLVDRLEKLKIPRAWAVVLVFLITLLLLVLLLLVLIPALVKEIAALFARVPEYLVWLQSRALPWMNEKLGLQTEIVSFDAQRIAELVREYFASVAGFAGGALSSITRSGGAFLAWLANMLLVPLVTFYLLRDWDMLLARLHHLIPRRIEPTAVQLARECDEALGAFLRGQLLVMIALGVIYSTGLWLVGLNNALAIGMIAGLVSFVPYLGVIVGLLLAGITAMIQNFELVFLLSVGAVFAVGQLLESFVLTPQLVGDRIGLHPVLVIFAIMAGGQLFGFTGVLMALPAAAAGMVLVRYAYRNYLDSGLYREAERAQKK